MQELVNTIQTRFRVTEAHQQRPNLYWLMVDKAETIPLITYLRDYEGFSHFVLLSAVDWMEEGVFQLTYLLNNPTLRGDLGIRTLIARENASMTSAHHLWQQVATYQRELKEMYGIDFPGSPRVDEDFILEGWDNIPPMRRDFDTKKFSEDYFFPRPGSESRDTQSYMKQKLYPDDDEKK